MSASQRNKGAGYEREIATQLTNAFSKPVKRNIGQARDGGNDIDLVANGEKFRIEAKRRATLGTIEGWMKQCTDSCGLDDTPVVVMRSDGGESMALLKLEDFIRLMGGAIA